MAPSSLREDGDPLLHRKGKGPLGNNCSQEKTASVLFLTSVKNEDEILEAIKANFYDKFDEVRKKWGGGIMGTKISGQDKGQGETHCQGSCSEDDLLRLFSFNFVARISGDRQKPYS